MKPESSPIADDEWLLRIVFEDRFYPEGVGLSPRTFEPRDGRSPDTDGISLFREACLSDASEIRFTNALKTLADAAHENIVLRPQQANPDVGK